MTKSNPSKQKRVRQREQEVRAARRRRCVECQQDGALVQITNGHRCRACGATWVTQ
jgi:hypothetical protein